MTADIDKDEIELTGVMSAELRELCKINCLFIGHSFVKHFCTWMYSFNNPFGKNLSLDYIDSINFVTGYTIPSLYKALLHAHDKVERANIIILDIGGNDLTDYACDEFILHEMMLALIRHIRSVNSFATLIVFQLLHRLHLNNRSICTLRRRRFGVCCSNEFTSKYNKRVDAVNIMLKKKLSALMKVKYWCHRCLWSDKKFTKFYLKDGVHLSATGMLRYARSVRGAILYYTERS